MTVMAKHTKSSVMPTLRYRDAPSAIEWLCNVLGFRKHAIYGGPDNTIAHAELTLEGGMIMIGSQKDDDYGRAFKTPAELGGVETRSTYVVVADADAVHARAQQAGAEIVRTISNTEYGSREFMLRDPEGHSWSVGTYDPWTTNSTEGEGA
jgi:uncharacterized glyoxalase superfamily protein PhnB